MADKTLQETLLEEFFNEQNFPTQHAFAARAEIRVLRERVAELEGKKHAKGEKGGSSVQGKSESVK